MPAKDRSRLTEPYVTTREKGTGLGLAIVDRSWRSTAGSFPWPTPPACPAPR
ncbi:MAG: hypothetical protein WDM85_11040 [Caulobacteraceae bacterium]